MKVKPSIPKATTLCEGVHETTDAEDFGRTFVHVGGPAAGSSAAEDHHHLRLDGDWP
jgi:hypothetical protein